MSRCVIEVVCGKLELIESNGYLISCSWTETDAVAPATELLKKAEKELREYFSGKCQSFIIPLAASGTEFECTLWEAMEKCIRHPAARRALGNRKYFIEKEPLFS